MRRLLALFLIAAAGLVALPAVAQVATAPMYNRPGGQQVAAQGVFCVDQTGAWASCAPGAGGGGGGAVTAADGALVTIGALADAACTTDNAACSLAALAKRNNQRLTSILTALGSPFQAGGSIANTAFGISGTLPAFAVTPTFNCGTGCYQATQPVSGTFWQATQPVSAASLPLPSGAATETTLAAASAKLPASLGPKTPAASMSVTRPQAVASTVTASTVALANTFQTALAASTARMGCNITNKSTATLLVSQAASPTAANSRILAAGTATTDGGVFNCSDFGVTVSDLISVTSATAGAAFLVVSQ